MSHLVVFVYVRVKPEHTAPFLEATRVNASASLLEAGVVRFDVSQQQDDDSRFVLVEVYRDANAAALHKETPHYLLWRDTVADMMAEPRRSVRCDIRFPALA